MWTSNYSITNPISSNYTINNCIISMVTSSKYLGTTITHNLSWSKHISTVTNKAHSVRGFLQRNLRQCLTTVKSKAYLAFVWPIVQYASVVWSPHTNVDITTLEMVQRKAARFVFNDFLTYSSVTTMMQELNWYSLQDTI